MKFAGDRDRDYTKFIRDWQEIVNFILSISLSRDDVCQCAQYVKRSIYRDDRVPKRKTFEKKLMIPLTYYPYDLMCIVFNSSSEGRFSKICYQLSSLSLSDKDIRPRNKNIYTCSSRCEEGFPRVIGNAKDLIYSLPRVIFTHLFSFSFCNHGSVNTSSCIKSSSDLTGKAFSLFVLPIFLMRSLLQVFRMQHPFRLLQFLAYTNSKLFQSGSKSLNAYTDSLQTSIFQKNITMFSFTV